MPKRITVRVKPDGKVEVSVDGLKGSSCSDATKAIEKALGATTSDKRTPDFFLRPENGQQVQNGGAS